MARIIDTICGHKNAINILTNGVQQRRLSSVYIFSGPSGVGKKMVALGLAQEILCSSQPACGTCQSCLDIQNLQHDGVRFIEPDGQFIKIQQAREILDYLSLQKLGRARVIIINEAHALNPQSANLLLKTLEEPPPDTYFFLITHLEKSILPTIRSRAQVVRFSSLTSDEIKRLTQAADWLVAASQGRLDVLEQFQNPKCEDVRLFAVEFLEHLSSANVRDIFVKMKEQLEDKELGLFASLMLQQMIRDIYFLKHGLTPLIHSDLSIKLKRFTNLSDELLLGLFKDALGIERHLYSNVDRTLLFENFLLRGQTTLN